MCRPPAIRLCGHFAAQLGLRRHDRAQVPYDRGRVGEPALATQLGGDPPQLVLSTSQPGGGGPFGFDEVHTGPTGTYAGWKPGDDRYSVPEHRLEGQGLGAQPRQCRTCPLVGRERSRVGACLTSLCGLDRVAAALRSTHGLTSSYFRVIDCLLATRIPLTDSTAESSRPVWRRSGELDWYGRRAVLSRCYAAESTGDGGCTELYEIPDPR